MINHNFIITLQFYQMGLCHNSHLFQDQKKKKKKTGLLFNLQLRKQFEERRLMEVHIQNWYYFFNVFAHESFLIWCSH